MKWLATFDWFSVFVYFTGLCALDLFFGRGSHGALSWTTHAAINAPLAFVLVWIFDPANKRGLR